MKYRNIMIALGFFVIIIQLLRFPDFFNSAIYVLTGLVIILLAYLSGKEYKKIDTKIDTKVDTTSNQL